MFTLTKELTKQYKESFQSKPERIVAQNAAVKNGLKGSSETVASVVENQPVYSIDLEHGKGSQPKGFWSLLDVCGAQYIPPQTL